MRVVDADQGRDLYAVLCGLMRLALCRSSAWGFWGLGRGRFEGLGPQTWGRARDDEQIPEPETRNPEPETRNPSTRLLREETGGLRQRIASCEHSLSRIQADSLQV